MVRPSCKRAESSNAGGLGQQDDVVVLVALTDKFHAVSVINDDHQAVLGHPLGGKFVVEGR